MLAIILAILILVCAALVGVILLQQSEGGALGMGGGPTGFMSARGAGDLLTRTTWILAGLFFALCLALAFFSGHMANSGSVTSGKVIQAAPVAPAPPKPAGFDAPQPEIHNATPASADPFGNLTAPKPVSAPAPTKAAASAKSGGKAN